MRGMRADVCEPDDSSAIERFKAALKEVGAVLTYSHESALGVDIWRFSVGDDEVTVFADAWSVDVEGPEAVVNRLLAIASA
jgi:hypothetical protein